MHDGILLETKGDQRRPKAQGTLSYRQVSHRQYLYRRQASLLIISTGLNEEDGCGLRLWRLESFAKQILL